jgi:hypothetical protein
MKKIKAELLIGCIVILIVTCVALIYSSLEGDSSKTPRDELKIEIAKVLTTVLGIGILGLFAKQLLGRIEKEREARRIERTTLRDTFDSLKKSCRKAIEGLKDPKASATSFSTWFKHPESWDEFDDLLDVWRQLDPESAAKIGEVRTSYRRFQDESVAVGEGPEFRKKAVTEIQEWLRYFTARWIGHDAPELTSSKE